MFYNLNSNCHACCILEPADKCCSLESTKCDDKLFNCKSKKAQCGSDQEVKTKCPVTCQNCGQGRLVKTSCH